MEVLDRVFSSTRLTITVQYSEGPTVPYGTVGPSLYCTVIVKRVDEKTRSKTSINDLLRD